MNIPYNDIEKSLIGSFNIHKDIHPLFRTKDDLKIEDANRLTTALDKTTNEKPERKLQGESFVC